MQDITPSCVFKLSPGIRFRSVSSAALNSILESESKWEWELGFVHIGAHYRACVQVRMNANLELMKPLFEIRLSNAKCYLHKDRQYSEH